ncbi:cell wall hydrolase [Roseateles toxinivorans]|uniref:Cell wall hydrolase n=2 Tax=Roseateles toxinivorans TaxID=270368 RepID=A0A4R6QGY7_9BURK|nr:cell wall hydrolase [Roseateles toxinivorans]
MLQRALHLNSTRAALNALLREDGRDPVLAHRLGLAPGAAMALCWLHQPLARRVGEGPAFMLGFDDSCAGRWLPTELRSALDGSPLPVRSLRGARHGLAQSWVRTENLSHNFLDGTLAAVLRRPSNPSRLLALTAGHVLGAGIGSASGDDIIFQYDGEDTSSFSGRLFDWQPNFEGLPADTRIDAALAEVSIAALAPLAARPADWPRGVAPTFADDRLRLRTRGREIGGDSPGFLSARLCVAGDLSKVYRLQDALCWRSAEATEAGDSGAPVWNDRDELVAIHAGAAPEGALLNAVAVPITPILDWAGAQLVRRGEPLLRQTMPRDSAVPLAPAAVSPAAPSGGPSSKAVTLARTMWGEARGEAGDGMAAVAHVVLNRVARQTYWGRDVIAVCQKPWQFSCWNRNDPNLPQLLRVDGSDARFRLALDLAGRLLAQPRPQREAADPTRRATHYHTCSLNPRPRWALGREPCARIGAHLFYNDIA